MSFWLMAANVALAAAATTCLGAAVLAIFHLIVRALKRARMSGELVRYLRRTLEAERAAARRHARPSGRPSIPSPAV